MLIFINRVLRQNLKKQEDRYLALRTVLIARLETELKPHGGIDVSERHHNSISFFTGAHAGRGRRLFLSDASLGVLHRLSGQNRPLPFHALWLRFRMLVKIAIFVFANT